MTSRRSLALTLVAILPFAQAGCGGGGTSAPTPVAPATPAPAPQLPAGTVLTVVSGDDGAPVSGASVQVGSAAYRTDPSGRLSLATGAPIGGVSSPQGALVVIEAPGFLTRRTLLRSAAETEFALWPSSIPGKGVDEKLTSLLVYTSAVYCCPDQGGYTARASLARMRAPRTVSVGMPDAYRGTVVSEWIQDAMGLANEASGGRVTFVLSGSSAGDVQIRESFTGSTPQGTPAAGYFTASIEGGYIRGGEITLSAADWASDPPANWPRTFQDEYRYVWKLRHLRHIVAHELGHCLGLQHHEEKTGMMTSYRGYTYMPYFLDATELFTPAEIALVRLAYLRPAGNQFPDSDDRVFVSSARRRAQVCVLQPGPERGRRE